MISTNTVLMPYISRVIQETVGVLLYPEWYTAIIVSGIYYSSVEFGITRAVRSRS